MCAYLPCRILGLQGSLCPEIPPHLGAGGEICSNSSRDLAPGKDGAEQRTLKKVCVTSPNELEETKKFWKAPSVSGALSPYPANSTLDWVKGTRLLCAATAGPG